MAITDKNQTILDEVRMKPSQIIDLNKQASPAVLSGMFGVNVKLIYQYRQDGKLPPNTDATYKECVHWYANFWKAKSKSKASDMVEASLIQKIKLDAAKTEQAWLNIKKERGELVDTAILAERFESHFIQMRMQLTSLARTAPEYQVRIDKMLASWDKLGQGMLDKSNMELESFIQQKMEEEIEVEVKDE